MCLHRASGWAGEGPSLLPSRLCLHQAALPGGALRSETGDEACFLKGAGQEALQACGTEAAGDSSAQVGVTPSPRPSGGLMQLEGYSSTFGLQAPWSCVTSARRPRVMQGSRAPRPRPAYARLRLGAGGELLDSSREHRRGHIRRDSWARQPPRRDLFQIEPPHVWTRVDFQVAGSTGLLRIALPGRITRLEWTVLLTTLMRDYLCFNHAETNSGRSVLAKRR